MMSSESKPSWKKSVYTKPIQELHKEYLEEMEAIKEHLIIDRVQVLGGEKFEVRIRNVKAEQLEARVKELEEFLQHEDTTHHNYPNWWETRVRRWKKKMENGNDE